MKENVTFYFQKISVVGILAKLKKWVRNFKKILININLPTFNNVCVQNST